MAKRVLLRRDFGEGWMTNGARDLAKIAVGLGGFNAKDLARRLAMTKTRGSKINSATVGRVLDEMMQEFQPRQKRRSHEKR